MNTIIANFLGAVAHELTLFGYIIVAIALIALAIGYIIGRKGAIPAKKTRYFVDCDGSLRRWKFGQSKSQVWCNRWANSSYSLKRLFRECTEVDSLAAYRSYPKAFEKKAIEIPEVPQNESIFNVVDNWTHDVVFSGPYQPCLAYSARVKEMFQTDCVIVKA